MVVFYAQAVEQHCLAMQSAPRLAFKSSFQFSGRDAEHVDQVFAKVIRWTIVLLLCTLFSLKHRLP